MNGIESHGAQIVAAGAEGQRKQLLSNLAFQVFDAVAVIVLAVIGLAGVMSATLASVAAIVLGASVLTEGGLFGARFTQARDMGAAKNAEREYSAPLLGGVAAVVLGILSLFRIYPNVLLSVAVIIFGATFLLGGADRSWLVSLLSFSPSELRRESGGDVLAGIAAIVLGILGVIGLSPLILVLAALLTVGVATLFTLRVIPARLRVSPHRGG